MAATDSTCSPTFTTEDKRRTESEIMASGEGEEKPVREKLKNAAISSQRGSQSPSSSDAEMAQYTPPEDDSPQSKQAIANGHTKPAKKRSLEVEDPKDFESGMSGLDAPATPSSGTHARKKNKEQKDIAKREASHVNTEPTLREESESSTSPKSGSEPLHADATLSPRRKRSADDMGTDSSRQPKVPATEEAQKARRSLDEERPSLPIDNTASSSANSDGSKPAIPSPSKLGGFSNASAASPFASFGAAPSSKPSPFGKFGSATSTAFSGTKAPATSAAAPASLSFATAKSPFSSAAPSQPSTSAFGGNSSAFGVGNKLHSFASGNGDFTSPNKAAQKLTSFASSSGGISGSAFGDTGRIGSTFGSVKGGDLSSIKPSRPFGAPQVTRAKDQNKDEDDSDANDSDNEDENGNDTTDGAQADDEADRQGPTENVSTGEEDEETIYIIARAKLYRFDGGWKERGVGMLKLNQRLGVASHTRDEQTPEIEEDDLPAGPTAASNDTPQTTTQPDADQQAAAVKVDEQAEPSQSTVQVRLLMRAMQTHRVILNAPVVKGLPFGDPADTTQPPSGKSMLFLTPDDEGVMRQHLIKIGREEELKTLYHHIKKFQNKS